MRKILHIIQGGKGGTLEYLKLLIPRINKQKYENIVICDGEIYKELTDMGIKTHKIEMVRNLSLFKDFKSLKRINKYISKNRPDLVYVHSSKAGVLGRISSKLNHIPCVYNPHGWAFNIKTNNVKRLIYRCIERIAGKLGDRIILISQSEFNDAINNGICDDSKLVVINNGIDLNKFSANYSETKEQLNLAQFKVIGMCCRLTAQKNPLKFINIANEIIRSNNNCKFILVGDGELMNDVEKRISELKLNDYFILTGWTNETEKYISAFDIGILSSDWEGFGLVLVQYMAAGKPVVASNVDGIPYVVRNNVDGFLCDSNSPKEFASKIEQLINNEELYKTMSKNALERSKEFDIQDVVKAHEKLFNELAK